MKRFNMCIVSTAKPVGEIEIEYEHPTTTTTAAPKSSYSQWGYYSSGQSMSRDTNTINASPSQDQPIGDMTSQLNASWTVIKHAHLLFLAICFCLNSNLIIKENLRCFYTWRCILNGAVSDLEKALDNCEPNPNLNV